MCPGTLVPAVAELDLVSLGRALGTIEMRLRTCRVCASGRSSQSKTRRASGLLASRSTLLRGLCQRRPAAQVQAPRVLGIDDWAWRKGHRYGIILCDRENRKVSTCYPTATPTT